MGICFGKNSLKRKENLIKFIENYRVNEEDYSALRIAREEVKDMFELFLELDEKRAGSIHVNKILKYTGITATPFARRALSSWDRKASGKLSFHHFVVTLWAICSLPKPVMGKINFRSSSPILLTVLLCRVPADFVFDLYDADGSGDLDIAEVDQLIKDLFGDAYASNLEAVT